MGETDYKIFLVLATLILLVFIGGIIVFITQYHKRKLLFEKEKAGLNEQHIMELYQTKMDIQKQTLEDLGREMHDNIVQRIALASIHANNIVYKDAYPQIRSEMTSISDILNESIGELRSLSKSLTNGNAHTDYNDLKEQVEGICVRIRDLNVCDVACSFTDDNFRISGTNKNFIVRIIQEFMQNSLKHANCKTITLSLSHAYEGLTVTVQDDGKGFDTTANEDPENRGIGLLNMKKRAELIGADFTFGSEINKGTQLSLFIPATKLNA